MAMLPSLAPKVSLLKDLFTSMPGGTSSVGTKTHKNTQKSLLPANASAFRIPSSRPSPQGISVSSCSCITRQPISFRPPHHLPRWPSVTVPKRSSIPTATGSNVSVTAYAAPIAALTTCSSAAITSISNPPSCSSEEDSTDLADLEKEDQNNIEP